MKNRYIYSGYGVDDDMDYGYGYDDGGINNKGIYTSVDYDWQGNPIASTNATTTTGIDTTGLMPGSYAGYGQNQGGLFSEWTGKDMVSAGIGAGQLGLGLLNYRNNKDFNKKRMSALDENIAASKEQRQQRRNFLSNTRSAFGA
jgi:hypothetical protein